MVSTQPAMPQNCWPIGHWHEPILHVPSPQSVLQSPQWCASPETSVHFPLQIWLGGSQPAWPPEPPEPPAPLELEVLPPLPDEDEASPVDELALDELDEDGDPDVPPLSPQAIR